MSQGAVPIVPEKTSPEEELLSWARKKTQRFSDVRLSTDQDGVPVFSPYESSGVNNLLRRLPLEEFLIDILTLYQDTLTPYGSRSFRMDIVAQEFQKACLSLEKYSDERYDAPPVSGRILVSDISTEILCFTRALLRMFLREHFDHPQACHNDHKKFSNQVVRSIDPRVGSLTDENRDRSIADYRQRALPMLHVLNHGFAASAFSDHSNLTAKAKADNNRSNILTYQTIFEYALTPQSLASRILFVVRPLTDTISQFLPPSQPPSTPPSERQQQIFSRAQALDERVKALPPKYQERLEKIHCVLPSCYDPEEMPNSSGHICYEYASAELIDTTFEVLENQVAFIERTAGPIDARRKADEIEVVRATTAKTLRENTAKITPIFQAVARLERGNQELSSQIKTLEPLIPLYDDLLQRCYELYADLAHDLSAVNVPFMAIHKQKKYLELLQGVINEFSARLSQLRASYRNISQETVSPPSPSALPVLTEDVPVDRDAFYALERNTQARQGELDRQKTALRKQLQDLQGAVDNQKDRAKIFMEAIEAMAQLPSKIATAGMKSGSSARDFVHQELDRIVNGTQLNMNPVAP